MEKWHQEGHRQPHGGFLYSISPFEEKNHIPDMPLKCDPSVHPSILSLRPPLEISGARSWYHAVVGFRAPWLPNCTPQITCTNYQYIIHDTNHKFNGSHQLKKKEKVRVLNRKLHKKTCVMYSSHIVENTKFLKVVNLEIKPYSNVIPDSSTIVSMSSVFWFSNLRKAKGRQNECVCHSQNPL